MLFKLANSGIANKYYSELLPREIELVLASISYEMIDQDYQ